MDAYWNRVYEQTPLTALGWYEETPHPSLALIERSGIGKAARILDAGAGATTLLDHLLARGYQNLVAVDISTTALAQLQERLGDAASVQLHVADLSRPGVLAEVAPVALWHDRGCFHFLQQEAERAAYHSTLCRLLEVGGQVVLATFAMPSERVCTGLPVQYYNQNMLASFLGEGFQLLEALPHQHQTPSGATRPFIYTRFLRLF